MCGICGIINLKGYRAINKQALLEMQNMMLHRGPDDEGCYIDDNFGMGFRRLSIIGLQNGRQPLFNENGSLVLVCNGEIFNFKDLKSELEKKGHIFSSDTDVEVLLHLYEEHGLDLFDLIRGQFAFALYDRTKQRLILARDHFGIVPLYYIKLGEQLVFASEIKAILKYSGVPREVDLTGVDQILSLPGLVSPRTAFRHICSVSPGNFLLAENGAVLLREYWDVNYPEEDENINAESEQYYLDRLEEILLESVKLRLISDVPVGAYLSGGLDSALITGLIKRGDPDPKTTLSMTFEDEFFNEEYYQDLMSSFLEFNHIKIKFATDQIMNNMRKVIWHCECPLKETYNTTSLALSAAAKQHGLKVILSGEGADELFAGYPSYRFDVFRRKAKNRDIHDDEKDICNRLWGVPNFFYEKKYLDFREVKKRLFSNKLNEIYPEFDFINHGLINKKRIKNREPLNIRSYLDLKLRIADHLVSDHGDRMLMANSVEGRYPFLDKELVEFTASMPSYLKLSQYQEKYILKKLGYKYIPPAIIEREKFGFSAPGSPHVLQANVEWINDLLSYNTISRQGYFDPDAVEGLMKKYSSPGFILNIPYEEDLLMPVITFGIFKELYSLPDF